MNYSKDFEKSIIGGLFLDPMAVETVRTIVKPSDFMNKDYGECLRAIFEMSDKRESIDALTLSDKLSSNRFNTAITLDQILYISESTPSAANIESYAEAVKDYSKRRAVLTLSSIAETADSGAEAVDEAMKTLLDLNKDVTSNGKHINQALTAFIENTEAIFNGNIFYYKTGLIDLDNQINGFIPGKLYVIGARPSMGKTALALNMMDSAEKQGAIAKFYSMEMSEYELAGRLVCANGGLNTRAIMNMQDEDWGRMTAGFNLLKDRGLWFDDSSGYDITYLKNSIRTHAAKHEKSIFFVDYLQLMKIKGENRVQGIGEITRELKNLARDVNCPIVILSQLNRGLEGRPDKRPVMSDLRESGEIEQDADVIMFIYRDEIYHEDSPDKGIAEILVRKNRQGELGVVRVASQLQFARFSNLSANYYASK